MIDSVYWIWFQLVFGIGTRRSELMAHFFENPKVIADGISSDRRISGMLEPSELENAGKAMERAQSIKLRTLKKGCDIITPDSEMYPPLLGDIYAKPMALYIKGDLSCLRDSLCVAMVGSRAPSNYGLSVARKLATGLAGAGAVIISGLANGVDAESHKAALEAGAKTVGILGCGIDVDYPRESAALKRAMSENGAVVTEYPLGSNPDKYHFPVRNRVISGMSHGVVVVEAGMNSGSLITADHALEQGRDVFAVPGSIFAESHEGANKLIKEGAKVVTSVSDILEEYPRFISTPQKMTFSDAEQSGAGSHIKGWETKPTVPANKRGTTGINSKTENQKKETQSHKTREIPPELSDVARAVLEKITVEPVPAEEIASMTNLETRDVLSSLTELEIYGLIRMYPGRKFSLN